MLLSNLLTKARVGAALIAVSLAASAHGADWPTRTVTIIDPYSPGGATDFIARVLAERLTETLGQSVIVENHGGGGSTIGTSRVTRAKPDGHTLLLNNMSVAFSKALYSNLNYDPSVDLTPIINVGSMPTLLAVSNAVEATTLPELLQLAKDDPDSLTYASAGVGSTGHMAMVSFQDAVGIDLEHIPYKGAGQALIDLGGDRVSILMNSLTPTVPYVESGKIRAIATSGKSRSHTLPDIPTIAEEGFPDFEYAPWFALFAPGKTPPEVVDAIHDAVADALADPAVAKKLTTQGIDLETEDRESFAKRYHEDLDKWTAVIEKLGLQLQ